MALKLINPYISLKITLAALISLFIFSAKTQFSYAIQQDGSIKKGTRSGLPLPRYASLKTDKVNVRNGPGKDHKVSWVYRKAGLPIEIIAEYENWRRVRDSEGIEGWVFHRLLSGRRTAIVTPWSKKTEKGKPTPVPIYKTNLKSDQNVALLLEPGIIIQLLQCDGNWCNFAIKSHKGWIQQEKLWGVYRTEKLK